MNNTYNKRSTFVYIILLHFSLPFLHFLHLHVKNVKKAYFNQNLKCTACQPWSKYTTFPHPLFFYSCMLLIAQRLRLFCNKISAEFHLALFLSYFWLHLTRAVARYVRYVTGRHFQQGGHFK